MVRWPLRLQPNYAFELPVMHGLNPTEARSAFWIWLFPNLALFLLPNHLFTLLIHPDGCGRTIESADLLVHPDALAGPDAQAKIDAIEFVEVSRPF